MEETFTLQYQALNIFSTFFHGERLCSIGEFHIIRDTCQVTGRLCTLFDTYIPGTGSRKAPDYDLVKMEEAYNLYSPIQDAQRRIFETMPREVREMLGLEEIYTLWERVKEELSMLIFSQKIHSLSHFLSHCEELVQDLHNMPLDPDQQTTEHRNVLEESVFPAHLELRTLQNCLVNIVAEHYKRPRLYQEPFNNVMEYIFNKTSDSYQDYHKLKQVLLRLHSVTSRLAELLSISRKFPEALRLLMQLIDGIDVEFVKTAGAPVDQINAFIENYLLPVQDELAEKVAHIKKITIWESDNEPQLKYLVLETHKLTERLKKIDVYYPSSRKRKFSLRD